MNPIFHAKRQQVAGNKKDKVVQSFAVREIKEG